MIIAVESFGSFDNLEKFLTRVQNLDYRGIIAPLAERGVQALRSATPIETGLAAQSWNYDISGSNDALTITWNNTDIENGFPVAIMLQYGYSTGTGGYVAGRDYINPAIQPIFDKIADEVWKAVISA